MESRRHRPPWRVERTRATPPPHPSPTLASLPHTRATPPPHPRKISSVIPAQNQLRRTHAKSAPSYPREISSVIPARNRLRHTRARRGYLAAPSTKPVPTSPTPHAPLPLAPAQHRRRTHAKSAPPHPREISSVIPARSRLRHTRARRGYLAAPSTKPVPTSPTPHAPLPLAPAQHRRRTHAKSAPPHPRNTAAAPTRNQLRHTRAKSAPSYPRSPRVSRRAEHQARSHLPNPTRSPPPRTRATPPPHPREISSAAPTRNQLRHTRAKSAPSYPREVGSVIPALAAGISPRRAPSPFPPPQPHTLPSPSHPRNTAAAPTRNTAAAPTQNQLRRTHAKSAPSYPREVGSVIPALAAGISPRRAPSPFPPPQPRTLPSPSHPRNTAAAPTRNQLRRTHAKSAPSYPRKISSVIPALAAGISLALRSKPRPRSPTRRGRSRITVRWRSTSQFGARP